MTSSTVRQPHFALLLGLAFALVVAQLVAQNWATTAQTLLDTDDAMRLAQMRDWLAGQSWYDMRQTRVAFPGYEQHWSRLIDAGLAGTLWFMGLFAEPALAERLMRTVWPMLWMLPTLAGTAAIAWRIAGREAALIALLLAVIGFPAFYQFRPGRIDHHNVQIALSVVLVAATVWSDRIRWTAWAAGVVTTLALAVGLECLPYLMACGAAFALRYAVDRSAAQPARDYGLALAASSAVAFFGTIGPDHWTRGACDAFAANWAALTVVCGLGLAFAGQWAASERMAVRTACAVGVGALAAAVFLAIEPRCIRGPFAMVDPAIWPIWLADVREMQPFLTLVVKNPITAIAIGAFPSAGLIAAVLLARNAELRRDFGFLVAAAVFVAAIFATFTVMKSYFYATWLGMPLVAAFAMHLFVALRLHSLVPRFAVGLMLTPAVLSIGAISIANAAGLEDRENFSRPEREACLKTENYAGLARLPAGTIATDIDFGPFLLALTPHRIIAAPYHRLSGGILGAHEAFASPPGQARDVLAKLGATYVITCGPRPPNDISPEQREASLWGRLTAGAVPNWLERVDAQSGPFEVYRIMQR